jgi:hypothetical protein
VTPVAARSKDRAATDVGTPARRSPLGEWPLVAAKDGARGHVPGRHLSQRPGRGAFPDTTHRASPVATPRAEASTAARGGERPRRRRPHPGSAPGPEDTFTGTRVATPAHRAVLRTVAARGRSEARAGRKDAAAQVHPEGHRGLGCIRCCARCVPGRAKPRAVDALQPQRGTGSGGSVCALNWYAVSRDDRPVAGAVPCLRRPRARVPRGRPADVGRDDRNHLHSACISWMSARAVTCRWPLSSLRITANR